MVIRGVQIDGLYKLMGKAQVVEMAIASSIIIKYGHMSERGLQLLSNKEFLLRCKSVPLEFCVDCICDTQRRISFSLSQ